MNIFTVTMVPVNPPYDDGVKNLVINIARCVRRHNFFLVSSCFGKAFPAEDNVTFLRSAFQGKGKHSMSLFQKIFVFLLITLNIKKIDAFQFFITPRPYFSRIFGAFLKRMNKRSIQVVSSVHTLYEKNTEKAIPGLFFDDHVVVYSDFARATLEKAGVRNVVRIYPGIDLNRFNKARDADLDLESRLLPRNTVKIIYPGTYKVLKESYSFEDFCGIAREVIRGRHDARFVMACRLRAREDKLLKKGFEEETAKAGIREHFIFLDTVDDMPSLFARCDIGIMPANGAMTGVLEIPMVLLEMASMGKVVVYGKVPPLDELNSKGLGVMLDNDSPGSYSGKILELLEDKRSALEAGKRSKEAVARFFNMDDMAREYEKLYKTLEG